MEWIKITDSTVIPGNRWLVLFNEDTDDVHTGICEDSALRLFGLVGYGSHHGKKFTHYILLTPIKP